MCLSIFIFNCSIIHQTKEKKMNPATEGGRRSNKKQEPKEHKTYSSNPTATNLPRGPSQRENRQNLEEAASISAKQKKYNKMLKKEDRAMLNDFSKCCRCQKEADKSCFEEHFRGDDGRVDLNAGASIARDCLSIMRDKTAKEENIFFYEYVRNAIDFDKADNARWAYRFCLHNLPDKKVCGQVLGS
jgi:hypothetical protein